MRMDARTRLRDARASGLRAVGLRVIGLRMIGMGAAALVGAAFALPQAASATAVADPAAALRVLNPADAQRYTQAFATMRRGDFIAGQNAEHALADPCLIGRLEAVRLLHPAYRAGYGELSGWLERYADLPEAPRVYDLALRHKPRGAPPPRAPAVPAAGLDDSSPAGVSRSAIAPPAPSPAANGRQQAARAAFYAGDVQKAHDLASASGERWIGGLSAYRLKRYPDALRDLSALADDPKQNPWVHAAAAYWASRSAKAVGDANRAHGLLKLAARSPDTFYGLIATRELDQQAARTPDPEVMGGDPIGAVLAAAAVDPRSVAELARSEPRAHRAAALTQIGLNAEAAEDLRVEMATAAPADRPRVTSLALALNAPVGVKADVARSGWARFDAGRFPTPILLPDGGFIVDKALVYALVRQESRFDANVVSGSGAYGLMQLTAATAARLAGDARLLHDPRALRNPALNLRLGQAYVAKLLTSVKGDVLRAVASYNCGPGAIDRLTARIGQDVDSLMLMESMPSSQTRDYVQRVMAGYWTYRQIFGLDSKTLDAAAAGTRVMASADF